MPNNRVRISEQTVSVIVPFHNLAQVKRAIQSVLDQDYKKVEVIAVDDGSSDGAASVVASLAQADPRVVLVTKENGGVSSARNAGLNAATGEYISFLDSDDWLEQSAITTAMRAMRQDGSDCVRFGHRLHDGAGGRELSEQREVRRTLESEEDFYDYAVDLLRGEEKGYAVTWLCRAEALHGVRFDESVHVMEDLLYVLELLASHPKSTVISSPLYVYDTTSPSATRGRTGVRSRVGKALDGELKVRELIPSWSKGSPAFERELLETRRGNTEEFLVRQVATDGLRLSDLKATLAEGQRNQKLQIAHPIQIWLRGTHLRANLFLWRLKEQLRRGR